MLVPVPLALVFSRVDQDPWRDPNAIKVMSPTPTLAPRPTADVRFLQGPSKRVLLFPRETVQPVETRSVC